MSSIRELLIEWAVMITIGVVLAALGPFGSFALGSFAVRLAYWVPAALIGYALFRPLVGIAQWVAERLDLPAWPVRIAAVAIAAAPASLFILWWNGNRFGALPSLENWYQLYVQVAVVGAVVTGLFVLLERRPPASPLASAEGSGADAQHPPPRFFERLPPAWNGDLRALQMEDHYVRAHGPDGRSELILMRMGDAERELGDRHGLRVHRSWWVARGAVERVIRNGRAVRIIIDGGLEAPVARDRLPALKAAGWL